MVPQQNSCNDREAGKGWSGWNQRIRLAPLLDSEVQHCPWKRVAGVDQKPLRKDIKALDGWLLYQTASGTDATWNLFGWACCTEQHNTWPSGRSVPLCQENHGDVRTASGSSPKPNHSPSAPNNESWKEHFVENLQGRTAPGTSENEANHQNPSILTPLMKGKTQTIRRISGIRNWEL